MIKAIVTGATGRMGSSIIRILDGTEGIELCGALERKDSEAMGRDVKELYNLNGSRVAIRESIEEVIDDAHVIIDFTSPDASMHYLKAASSAGKSYVLGTTGFSEEQKGIISDLCHSSGNEHMESGFRCVWAPNMSVGINVILKVLRDIAPVLAEDFDIEISEAHHKFKKDAPSGTAMKMAEVIADALRRDLDKVAVYGRRGNIGERGVREIGMQVIRAGDIVGEHTVLFGGIGERIEITHRAQSRDNFAKGAVRAALWVPEQPPGLYDMQDVLGLK